MRIVQIVRLFCDLDIRGIITQLTKSALFSPISFRQLELQNRIMVSPMCQYSSNEGCVSSWHQMHLGQFAVSGAGLLVMEMTNVEARGRISPYCVGLYSDANENALTKVVEFCTQHGDVPIGIQLAHAGRKASTAPPWQGRKCLNPQEGGWQTVAPSAIAFSDDAHIPVELSLSEIDALVESFEQSAKRANRIGFQAIELHAAHGYLLHQFLSPISNQRTDRYGGNLVNRMRFPLEVYQAVRSAWPEEKPIGVRISATDWIEGGWDLDSTIKFAKELKSLGCDWMDVSSGGISLHQDITTGPRYQVHLAKAVREQAGIATIAVGLITQARQAEAIIANGDADVVALARGMLYNPRWVWHAANELGIDITYPNQYVRCKPVVN